MSMQLQDLIPEMDTETTSIGSIEDIAPIGKKQLETEPKSTQVGSIKDKNLQEMESESTPVGSIEEIIPIGKQQQETEPERTPVGSKKDANHGKPTQEKDGKSTPVVSIEEISPIQNQQQHATNSMTSSHIGITWEKRPELNLPCGDLLYNRDDYINICIPLYHASMRGDWETATMFLGERPELVRCSISENHDTPLHIAALAKSTKMTEKFVENLVRIMTKKDLELQNKDGNTALCLAVTNGNVKIVETMVTKNKALHEIPGSRKMLPLYMASLFGHPEMTKYLYDNSKKMNRDYWTNQNRGWVLQKCVEADIFDVALKIVMDRPELVTNSGVGGTLLGILARKKDAFRGIKPNVIWRVIDQILAVSHVKDVPAEKPSDAMKLLRIIWSDIVKLRKNQIDNILRGPCDRTADRMVYSSRILFVAAEMGNTEFVVELFRLYPDLVWKVNDNNQTVFHVAVSHRYADIYSLLHEMGSMKDMITPLKDKDDNNMLHLVGKTALKERIQDVSGVVQMQRELLWFKEVEALIPPTYRERKNRDGFTPHELFTKEHKELMSSNEEWMKNTANQCLVVATLIASIGFAAAFAVPGGYDQNNGIPLFVKKVIFIIFTISDAISVAFSSISILTLLSIFTSRYAELDFLTALPNKLMRGIATLFLSLASMLVGFSFSFFLLFKEELIWVPVLIVMFTSIPVILYIRRQYELFMDVYHSTHGYLFKPKKHFLLYQNPRF